MCLGVPGRVMNVAKNDLGIAMGTVEFGGITKEVCLAYVPDVAVGEYVVVHVGFAISRISETEAREVFESLRALGELADLRTPQQGEPPPGSPA